MLGPIARRCALLGSIAALLVASPAALAAKPTGGAGGGGKGGGKTPPGTHTISLVLLESTDGLPHYGQRIEFDVSTTATDQPWVLLECYQSGSRVSQGKGAYFDGALSGRDFTLASPKWTGGAADCVANLTKPDWSVLATLNFHVYA
jgi:hypothetical protein